MNPRVFQCWIDRNLTNKALECICCGLRYIKGMAKEVPAGIYDILQRLDWNTDYVLQSDLCKNVVHSCGYFFGSSPFE